MKLKITIIILNYNGWEDTIECLKSLNNTFCDEQYDVSLIVVDNASQNESVEKIKVYLKSQYNQAFVCTTDYNEAVGYKYVLFRSSKNLGFSAGNNIGIRIAIQKGSEFVMMLNNDTTVVDGFMQPLVKMLLDNPDIGMVGPKIVDYYNRNDYTLGGYYNKYKGSGYSYYNTEIAHAQYINYLSGCCWLIRVSAFEKCGLMDEAYFLYVEDVDFSCTFVKKGYKLSCTKESIIYHKESRSTPVKTILYYYNTRNRLYLCKKLGYGFFVKWVFYTYLIATRAVYYFKIAELRPYIKLAVKDFIIGKYGKFEKPE